MSFYDQTEFRLAARARLRTIASYPGDSLIHWDGRTFSKPPLSEGVFYIRELLRTREEPGLSSGHVHSMGRCNFDVFVPHGSGTEVASAIGKEIVEMFGPRQSIAANGFAIVIDQSQRGDLRPAPSEDWSFLPVSFLWRVSTLH